MAGFQNAPGRIPPARPGARGAVGGVGLVFSKTRWRGGFCCARALEGLLPPLGGGFFHLPWCGETATTLPIAIAAGWGAPPSEGIALWLFGLFAVSIGLPFFTLSASAPLLQSWFASSGHPQAGNPYVLYAASNLGSFAALFAYPVVVEPMLTLKTQAAIWSVGFGLLAALLAAVGLLTARLPAAVAGKNKIERRAAPDAGQRLRWVALAAIPSGLLISVTAHLTTDIAAAPFLWVVPLALYLLTFVAVFRERPWIAHATVVRLTPLVVAPLAVSLIGGGRGYGVTTIVLNLAAFTLLTLTCHGELYAIRPKPHRLTEFYLCTSAGGVIGGAFAGLAAPQLFNGNYEYPILIAAALLCMPGTFAGGVRKALSDALPWLAPRAALALVLVVTPFHLPATWGLPFQIVLSLLAACSLFPRRRPARF